jgi:hypothetical protein
VHEPVQLSPITAQHDEVPVRRSPACRQSPWTVAALVFVVYGAWLFVAFIGGHDARERVGFGRLYVERPHAQALMHISPRSRFVSRGVGNDGQFYYFMAVDPVNGRYFQDDAAYRYKHILYPMLARLLALGGHPSFPPPCCW